MRQLPSGVVLFADVSRGRGKRARVGACVDDEGEDGERGFDGGGWKLAVRGGRKGVVIRLLMRVIWEWVNDDEESESGWALGKRIYEEGVR